MQFGMQGRTFRGLTQICLPDQYDDNSSPVLFHLLLHERIFKFSKSFKFDYVFYDTVTVYLTPYKHIDRIPANESKPKKREKNPKNEIKKSKRNETKRNGSTPSIEQPVNNFN